MKKRGDLKEVKKPKYKPQEQSELARLERLIEKSQIQHSQTVARADGLKQQALMQVVEAMKTYEGYKKQLEDKYNGGKKNGK